MNRLVILESPNKIKKVETFLKKVDSTNSYKVKASAGHIREIENTGQYNMGIDIDLMEAKFIISQDKKNIVNEICEEAKIADEIILATDPDREGEAIAWHLYEILKKYKKPFKRLLLNSITETEVNKKINSLMEIDINYVNAALARQIIDRIVGYRLSQNLQQNIGARSGGRVQSASLRILSERQKEHEQFKKKNYWVPTFTYKESKFNNVIKIDEKVNINKIDEELKAKEWINSLSKDLKVTLIDKVDFQDKAFIPFSTDTLLQNGKSKLKFNTKKTTEIAQKLFDKGWVTYIRTDSNNLDDETKEILKKYIVKTFGKEKLEILKEVKNSEESQEGHPAITPTHFEWDMNHLESTSELEDDEKKLYKLIWFNTINSMYLRPSGFKTEYTLSNETDWITTCKQYKNLGYYEIDKSIDYASDPILDLNLNDVVTIKNFELNKGTESGKPLLNQVTLIQEMKKHGIGRPSTYSSAVEVNINRKYAELLKDKSESINVLPIGFKVDDYLKNEFPEIINLEFTKQMEKDLDSIAKGEISDWKKYLKDFYWKFDEAVMLSGKNVEKCPKCKKGNWLSLVSKAGKTYFACSDKEICKHFDFPISLQEDYSKLPKCPKCKKGHKKKFKEGKNSKGSWKLYTCTNFKECDWKEFK